MAIGTGRDDVVGGAGAGVGIGVVDEVSAVAEVGGALDDGGPGSTASSWAWRAQPLAARTPITRSKAAAR